MKKSLILFLAFTAVLMSSCAKIYQTPDAVSITSKHKLIAIAPPKVSIAPSKKSTPEGIIEQQKMESTNFQKEMHSWLLRRKMQNRISVDILDIETTNTKLKRAGYFEGTPITPAEMSELLGVDAIITSNYSLSKPMSEGGAVALGLLFGVWGNTNEATVTLDLHDKETKKMIWNFNHKVGGSVFSSPAQLVDNLMRNASKKMPYSK
jgi:hypothetical protein